MRVRTSLVGLKRPIGNGGQCGTHQRTDDEDPEADDRRHVALKDGDDGRTEAARGIDGRAREADAEDVHEGEGEADDQTGERTVTELGRGNTQDGEHEDEGKDDLDDEAGNEAAVDTRQTIGTHATGHVNHLAQPKDAEQHEGTDERAYELGDYVAHEVLPAEPTAHKDSQGDGRVDVAARDVADAVGHGDDGQAERQCREQVATATRGVAANEHGGTAAHEGEHERTDKLCDVLLHKGSFLGLPSCIHSYIRYKNVEIL